jgi:hypothetical protein
LLLFSPESFSLPSAISEHKKLYKIIILSVVLYGYETWSFTLWEEHKLTVFENTVLRTIFGLKRDEVTGGWRKLHNEELRNLCSSLSIITPTLIKSKSMRWTRNIARMVAKRNVYIYSICYIENKCL